MKLLSRHQPGAAPQGVAVVESWGVDPVGAAKMESILARNGALLAGFTTPNPAGWGLAGSVATTDAHIWASPQAFTGAGTASALSAFTVGADRPTIYPVDAHSTNVVLPGRGGV